MIREIGKLCFMTVVLLCGTLKQSLANVPRNMAMRKSLKLESLLMLHQLCEPDLQTQPWFYGGDAKRNYEPWDARRSLLDSFFLKNIVRVSHTDW